METYLLISEAAKEVEVESHVLRYWEEELKLPIKRNEQGHRYYTREDVEFFKQIKGMKEKGLQLKAIKMIIKNGELETQMRVREQPEKLADSSLQDNKEDKTQRLQWLLQQLIREAVRENNRELCREIKESVVKELDYQFRNLEEREEQRDAARELREEDHFRKLDDLLRKKAGGRKNIERENDESKISKEKRIKLFKANKEK